VLGEGAATDLEGAATGSSISVFQVDEVKPFLTVGQQRGPKAVVQQAFEQEEGCRQEASQSYCNFAAYFPIHGVREAS
jgi:hypothetical protein